MNALRSITLLAPVLFCILGYESAAAQLSPQDKIAIRAIGDAALASLTAGDAATYAGLFREDGVLQAPDAPTVRGRAALADWAQTWRAATPADARLTWPNYHLYGDGNLAYVTTDYVLEVGNGSAARGKQLGVYRRDRGGHWQIAAVSFNSDLPAVPDGMDLTSGDRAAIEALATGYSKRALAGDFEGWVALYRADAVRMNPGASALEGRESIREWVNALDFTVRSHTMSPIEVEGTRELAYIRGTYRSELSVRVDGEEVRVPDEGSWLAVVRRDENGAWRFYRFIYNADTVPAPPEDR